MSRPLPLQKLNIPEKGNCPQLKTFHECLNNFCTDGETEDNGPFHIQVYKPVKKEYNEACFPTRFCLYGKCPCDLFEADYAVGFAWGGDIMMYTGDSIKTCPDFAAKQWGNAYCESDSSEYKCQVLSAATACIDEAAVCFQEYPASATQDNWMHIGYADIPQKWHDADEQGLLDNGINYA